MDNFRVLVVEDDPSILKLVTNYLQSDDISCDSAVDGLDAFEKLNDNLNYYHLILLDINMPRMNGLELVERLKELHFIHKIAIMSTLEDVSVLKKAISLGVDFFIDKPIDLMILREVLKKSRRSYKRKVDLDETLLLLNEYKDAVDESNIVSKTDPSGRITYANQKFCEISGYDLDELIGKPHSVVRHPDMPKEAFADLWKTIKDDKKVWRGIVKNRTKNGGYYVVDATIIPILDANKEVIEYIGIRHDITELEKYRELLETELDSSQMDLQQKANLLQEYEKAINISAPLSRMSVEGEITYVNKAFTSLFKYPKDSLVGKNFFEVFGEGSTIHIVKSSIEKIKRGKKPQKGVHILKNSEGEDTYLNCSLVPILDLDGKIIELMAIYSNITEVVNLNKEIEDTQREIIQTMGVIGESRSKETGEHVKRVAEISAIIGRELGLDSQKVELIKSASPMHDIGKIGIPDSILLKPGRLTPEEFEVIKTHSTLGYEMLKGSNRELLKTASIIAHEHHERWDGKGYPRGLSGEDIHIYGRITAIVDVFDALGSDRCYKKAWPLDKVLSLLKEERGKQFDPQVVDVFFDNLDEILELNEKISQNA
ncbi:MAG: HD domain-containing phosphohydrolase [Campylobacterales bacterium]